MDHLVVWIIAGFGYLLTAWLAFHYFDSPWGGIIIICLALSCLPITFAVGKSLLNYIRFVLLRAKQVISTAWLWLVYSLRGKPTMRYVVALAITSAALTTSVLLWKREPSFLLLPAFVLLILGGIVGGLATISIEK